MSQRDNRPSNKGKTKKKAPPCQTTRDDRKARLLRFLEQEIWSAIPPDRLGRKLSREEEEALLGYGPLGV